VPDNCPTEVEEVRDAPWLLLTLGTPPAVLLVVLFTVVDPDAPAVVKFKVLLVAELPDCDPLEEAPVENEVIEPDAPVILTAVCPALPVIITLAVPFPRTVARVAFAKAVVFPTSVEVVELPLLLKTPAPVEDVLVTG
jgi:hypothetical protein